MGKFIIIVIIVIIQYFYYCTHYNKIMSAFYSTLVKIQLTHTERRTKIMSFEKLPKVRDV